MGIEAKTNQYWIAPNAVTITLNALGNPNRTQGSVASGAVISCYVEEVKPESAGPEYAGNGDGLGLDNGRNPKRWPLSLSPTYFNSNTAKYVYVAIPRKASVGTQAVVVFPSERLDIFGKNNDGSQIGSTDFFYVWLQSVISSTDGTTPRTMTEINFGALGTYEDIMDMSETDWYSYSKVTGIVTFLKGIVMKAGTTFQNLILGDRELTGVATAATGDEFIDSEKLVVTPSYINNKYLSKATDDVAHGEIGFLKGLWIKAKNLFGFDEEGNIVANTINALSGIIDKLQSTNYKEGELTGTGWQLTNDNGDGQSKLEADIIVARTRFIVNELQVRKYVAMGGNYVFSPAASQIERVDYLDENNDLLGYEKITVPLLVRIGNAIRTLLKRNGNNRNVMGIKRVVKSLTPVDPSLIKKYRCWIKADDGTTRTINTWAEGMLARCQTSDIVDIKDRVNENEGKEEIVNGKIAKGNVYYWRLVKAAGQAVMPVDGDGKQHSYVDLSNISGEYNAGSMAPQAGDDIVCFGATKREYSNLIIIETTTGDAPAVKEYYGVGLQDNNHNNGANDPINWDFTGKEVTRISPKGNVFNSDFFKIRVNNNDMSLEAYFNIESNQILFGVNGLLSNPNLFPGIDKGDGWEKSSYDEEDNVFASENNKVVSPYMQLSAGQYVLSFWCDSNTASYITVKIVKTKTSTISYDITSEEYGKNVARTFKLSASDKVKIEWEADSAFTVTKPKLETGSKATSWEQGAIGSQIKATATSISLGVQSDIEGKLANTGIEIQGTNSTINLIAGKVNFKASNGTSTNPYMSIGSDGKLTVDSIQATNGNFSGTVRATNLFHSVLLHGNENVYYCQDDNVSPQDGHVYPYVKGRYYLRTELDAYWNTTNLQSCTYAADIVIVPHGSSDTGGVSIDLPMATDFDGKLVEIVDTRYTQPNTSSFVGGLTVYQCDGASKIRGTFGATPAQYVRLNASQSHDGGNYRILSYGGYWVRLSTIGNV